MRVVCTERVDDELLPAPLSAMAKKRMACMPYVASSGSALVSEHDGDDQPAENGASRERESGYRRYALRMAQRDIQPYQRMHRQWMTYLAMKYPLFGALAEASGAGLHD